MTETSKTSGLQSILDPKNYPIYDRPETESITYDQAGQDILKALEDRYAQPNWFKVAAGFLKPQLGGFAASLGSASEALGENVEQQRAMALPIAEVRAKLAQGQALLQQSVPVADEIKQWHKDHPNEMPTPGKVAHWASKAPDLPAVKALLSQQTLSQKNQELLQQQQQTELSILQRARESNLISRDEYNSRVSRLMSNLGGMATAPNVKSTENAVVPNVSAPPSAIPSANTSGTTSALPNASTASAPQVSQNAPTSEPEKKQTQPKTETSSTNFDDFKIKPTYTANMYAPQAVTEIEKKQNANIDNQVNYLEAERAKAWQGLQKAMIPINFNTAQKANEAGIQFIDKNPESMVRISGLLREKGGVAGEILAGGLGVSFGPYGASFSLRGLEPALLASLKKEDRDAFDKIGNYLAKSVYYDLMMRGINPEQEGAEKFGQRMLQEANMRSGAQAIHRTFEENNIRLQHNKDVHKALLKYLPKAVAEGSLTPLHDLYMQHPEMQVLDAMLKKKLAKID
jgi:hypothetical protein